MSERRLRRRPNINPTMGLFSLVSWVDKLDIQPWTAKRHLNLGVAAATYNIKRVNKYLI